MDHQRENQPINSTKLGAMLFTSVVKGFLGIRLLVISKLPGNKALET